MPELRRRSLGFTLIEMSIVLVIIGLIIGGVLVGRDLIKASEIRATVSQYEKYNSAVNTFYGKYGGLPADLVTASAQAYGFPWCTYTTQVGNGDGLITDRRGGVNQPEGEPLLFWPYLTVSQLVEGSYGVNLYPNNAAYPGINNNPGDPGWGSNPAGFYPTAKVRSKSYWLVGSNSGVNYYVLAGVNEWGLASNGAYYTFNQSNALSPVEAFGIDSKVDDGLPNTGRVQARVNFTGNSNNGGVDLLFTPLAANTAGTFATTPASGTCQIGSSAATDPANTYAVGSASGSSPACNLRLQFQ